MKYNLTSFTSCHVNTPTKLFISSHTISYSDPGEDLRAFQNNLGQKNVKNVWLFSEIKSTTETQLLNGMRGLYVF